MGSDITGLEASIVWLGEGVGEGRAKGVPGHGDLRREEGLGGKEREGQEGHRGQWNKNRTEVQKQTEIRRRGTWNGGGGEESLEIIGTGTERRSLRRGGSRMQKNGTKRKRKRANVA